MIAQAEFDAAHDQWYRETFLHSLPWTILEGAGFERVKAFGKDAIPFLLAKLRESLDEEERHEVQVWGIHAMLPELTGVDEFVGEVEGGFVKGDVRATTEAWIKWGEDNGHL